MRLLIALLTLVALAATAPAFAQSLAGEWDWGAGGGIVLLGDDANGTDSRGNTARWSLADAESRTYSLVWSHGYTDRAVLSIDGGSLDVVNNVGTRFTARRRGIQRSVDASITGDWKWGVGAGTVSILPDGSGRDERGNTMKWTPKPGEAGVFILVWTNGYTDTARLSSDGKRLDIVNSGGTHFVAERIQPNEVKPLDLNGSWNNNLLHIWQDGVELLVTASWKRDDGKYVIWRGEGTLEGNVATLAIRYSPMAHGPVPHWRGVFAVSADGNGIEAHYTCECPLTDDRVYRRDP